MTSDLIGFRVDRSYIKKYRYVYAGNSVEANLKSTIKIGNAMETGLGSSYVGFRAGGFMGGLGL